MELILIHKIKGFVLLKTFMTGASLRRYIINANLKPEDYCLIEGKVLKTFENFTTTKGENLCHG